jgi:sugar/nucleoside kinase (ribokinase family)
VAAYDYTTVGHVTVDVFADGSRRAGGGAFYSALQAARLGQRTLIITQGVVAEIQDLLAPYRSELALQVIPAQHTTTLQTSGQPLARTQHVLSWAGPIERAVSVDTSILHLAPVARETAPRWRGRSDFVGLTPQGLVRTWASPAAQLRQQTLDPADLPERCEAIVISQAERQSCAWLIAAVDSRPADARTPGTVIAITAGADATALHLPGGPTLELEVPRVEHLVDDIGAGDVFAAAFFVALHEGRAPADAATLGNAAAAVRIGGAGSDAVGTREVIRARLRRSDALPEARIQQR